MNRWQQIESLFQEALQRPPGERDAWLQEACGTDVDLHREVTSLLANHQDDTAKPWVSAAAQLIAKPIQLVPGQYVGPYQITSFLAAGGMGEVYRARDTKLKRDVALKVLPEAFARDAERIARFRREAQLLAALNHPNIAAIYGLEEADGIMALVMEEVVEGEPVSGALGIDAALRYARQIAEALEAAHEKGIIHRDLKPANIKVTPEGVVKVLDFGLATIVQPGSDAEVQGDIQDSPTRTGTPGTQPGVIMGTAAYMSPEQAAGKPVDKRSDIWSYGVVLFEMLTGQRLFDSGETISHTLADVLRAPIDFSRLPAATPPAIRDLLRRCLDRDVKNRLRDIGEARVAIDSAGRVLEQAPPLNAIPQRRSGLWIAAAVVTAVVAGIVWFGWWHSTKQVERPLMRFDDDLGEGINTASNFGPAIAISSDGLRLAFISQSSDGKSHLVVRSLESSKSTVLSGAEGDGLVPSAPFFSPDGRWIGFFSTTNLKKISVEGGGAVQLCDVGVGPRGGFWGTDGNIFFAGQRTPLMRVSQFGGTAVPVTELDKQKPEVTNRFAQVLPGGKAILFTASVDNNVWESATIYAQTLSDGKRKSLVTGGYFGRYMAGSGGGHLIYVHDGTLWAAPFDLNRLELTAQATPVLEDVDGHPGNGFSQFDVSASGTLVYVAGSSRSDRNSLAFVDASGNVQVLPVRPASYQGPLRPSPDGKRIALRIAEGTSSNLAIFELSTNQTTPLTFIKGAIGNLFTWTPDGKHIVFSVPSNDLSGPGLYWRRTDGAGEPQRLLDRPVGVGSFSPDGEVLAYTTQPGSGKTEAGLWTLSLDLTNPEHPRPGKPNLFLDSSKAWVAPPAISPDGMWLAYVSTEAQSPQFFVRPFSFSGHVTGGPWQISQEGGQGQITWVANSKELIYLSPDGRPFAVSYTVNGESFVPNPPRLWSEKFLPLANQPGVMPDGKRFIVVLPSAAGSARRTHASFLLNFSDELQRRAGR